MDTKSLRRCMGSFGTGVAVVTCVTEDGPHGFTVNSFTSISMEPPLVMVAADRSTTAVSYLRDAPFAVSILASNQREIAMHFAGKQQDDIFLEWDNGLHAPLVSQSLASVECLPWCHYEAGDHVMFLGRVDRFYYRDGEALGFYGGNFLRLSKVQEEEHRYHEFYGISF